MNPFSLFRGDGLRGRSIRSSFFTIMNIGSENLLRLGGNLILTRLLFPEAFGIMALVQVVMMGLRMFSDIGVRLSIVQNERGNDPLFLDTAWVLQIGRGVVLWLATVALAVPMASFYDADILTQLLPVAGLTALFQGFNSTKLATADRYLVLGRVTAINVIARVIGLIVLVGLAFWWRSTWALVIGGLVAPFAMMVMSHLFLPGHNNRFRFDRAAARTLIKFGKYIFLATIAGFLLLQADRAILGKLVSLTDLALYNIAIQLATLPRVLQQNLVSRVLYSLYSTRPPSESQRNYRDIARARFLVVGTTMAMALVLALIGNALIVLLYDPRYETAGGLLVLMAVGALPGLINTSYSTVMLAAGDSGRFALVNTIAAVLQIAVLVVGISAYGVVGAALSPLVSGLLFYPIIVLAIRPYNGWIPRHDVLFALFAAAGASLALWVNADVIAAALEQFTLL